MKLLSKIFGLDSWLRHIFYCRWNRLKFKLKKVEFGKCLNVSSQMYLRVSPHSVVRIGDNFNFMSGECYNPLCRNIKGCIVTEPEAEIIIGNNVGVSSPCIWAHKKISIGDNVNIVGDCLLMDSDAHSLNFMHRRLPAVDKENKKDADITSGNDGLIGTRCIILKGVTIGARSVIGSGSVVTKSIPADCIAAGNPCKIIRYINE